MKERKNNDNEEFKGFDENSRIIINDNENGDSNHNNNNIPSNNSFSRVQNYLLGLTDRLQIQSNMKLFFVCLIISGFNFFSCLISLPFIFLSPSKLLSKLSFFNILLIVCFLFYYGSSRFFGFLRDSKRFRITLIHLILIILGFCLPMFRGYFLSFLLDLALIITTVMFLLTIIPGGQRGINAIQGSLYSLFFDILKRSKK